MHWGKVRTVSTFEFLSTVKRKGYLITTFGMPVFLVLYGLVLSGIGFFFAEKESEVKVYGIVERSGVLRLTGDVSRSLLDELPADVRGTLQSIGQEKVLEQAFAFQGNVIFRPFDEEEAARSALNSGDIRGYFLLHPDYVQTGIVEDFAREGPDVNRSETQQHLKTLLVERILEGQVSEDVAQRVHDPIAELKSWTVTETGELEERNVWSVMLRLIVPLALTVLLFISLMMSASYLVQGTAIEKENRVVEVLLSSANPDEILIGKLFGLGGAGLLQVAVWLGMVVVGGLIFAGALAAAGVEVPWFALATALLFFLAGYLFLGSLMLGVGSIGNSLRESQQLTAVITLLTVVPMVFLGILIQDPHSTPGVVMSWIPFTAPVTVILRLTLEPEGIAWWEIAGSLAMMAVSTWLAIRFAARLFRVGLLLTGVRPKLREILRQARLSH